MGGMVCDDEVQRGRPARRHWALGFYSKCNDSTGGILSGRRKGQFDF